MITGCELPLQISHLLLRQSLGDHIKDGIDEVIDSLRYMPTLIKQWYHSLVFDGTLNVIDIDQAAKLIECIPILLHQRCAGEADVAGVWQRQAHLGVDKAVLATMAFIDQYEDIRIGVLTLHCFYGVFELVNDRGDDKRLVPLQQLAQVFAGFRLLRLAATMLERVVDLIIQVNAISNKYDLIIVDTRFHCDSFGQHDHGERFTASLGMPDNATFPGVTAIPVAGDPRQNLFHAEKLLVTSDLLFSGVKNDIAIGES